MSNDWCYFCKGHPSHDDQREELRQLRNKEFTLFDDPGPGKMKGKIVEEGGGLSVYFDGYNDGQPVAALVFHDGRLKLLAFPDINNEEPVAIDLEGAKE